MGLYKIRSLWVLWVHIELYQPCADSERMIIENLSVVPCGLQKSLRQDHPKIIRKSSENGTKNPQALAAGTAADSFCSTHRGSPFRGGLPSESSTCWGNVWGQRRSEINQPRFLLAHPIILWIHGCVQIPSLNKKCRPTRSLPKMSSPPRTFCSFHMWLWWIRKSTVFYLPIWRHLRWSILVHLLKLRWGGEVGDWMMEGCCWWNDMKMAPWSLVVVFFWLWNPYGITPLTGRWEEVPEDCSRSAGWVPSKMLKNLAFLAAGLSGESA